MRNLFRALYWGFKGFRVKGLAMWGVLGIEALVLCGFLLIYAGKRTNRAIDPGGGTEDPDRQPLQSVRN